MYEERKKIYDSIVATSNKFERKGKTMPYTSANGHMFSQLNKDGEIGIRLSKESQKAFMEKYNATEFRSYGAVMRGYVQVPAELLSNMKLMAELIDEGYEYVMSLPAK